MIKAVIFDVDGVLIDSFEANWRFFQELLSRFNYTKPTHNEYKQFFHLSMRDAIKAMTGIESEKKIDEIWTAGKNRAVRYPTETVKSPDGIDLVIELLSKKYKLAIVTSRIRNTTFEFKTMEKLQRYFSVVVSYEDTKKHKPDPAPLNLAMEKLGLKNSECVYVGDAATDIQAARHAGMKIITYPDINLTGADAQTSDFRKLPQIINKLNSF